MGAKIQAFDIFQTPLSSHYPLPLSSPNGIATCMAVHAIADSAGNIAGDKYYSFVCDRYYPFVTLDFCCKIKRKKERNIAAGALI
jgi:hypothetical protein